MSCPRISILIPVYNNHEYLDCLLESILQYSDVFQIVVSDDNPSNKYSGDYLMNEGIVWNFNENNLGRCGNYLRLLDFVTCDYFMFMDGDDELCADLCWDKILDNFNYGDIVIGNYLVDNGKATFEVVKFEEGVISSRDFFLKWNSWRLNPANGACIYKSAVLKSLKLDELELDILNWDIHWQRSCLLEVDTVCLVDDCIFIWNYTGENGSVSSSLIEDLKNYNYISSVFAKAARFYGVIPTSIWWLKSSLVYCWFLFLKYIWKRRK